MNSQNKKCSLKKKKVQLCIIRLKFKKHPDIVENNVVFVPLNMRKILQPCNEYMHKELFVRTGLIHNP